MNNFTNIWMTGHSGFLGKSLVKKLIKEILVGCVEFSFLVMMFIAAYLALVILVP